MLIRPFNSKTNSLHWVMFTGLSITTKHTINEMLTRKGRRRSIQGLMPQDVWPSTGSLVATFLSLIDVLDEFMSQPQRCEYDRAGNMETLSHTNTHRFFSFCFVCHCVFRYDRKGHSTVTVTLLVFFPVVLETSRDLISNKTNIHQATWPDSSLRRPPILSWVHRNPCCV